MLSSLAEVFNPAALLSTAPARCSGPRRAPKHAQPASRRHPWPGAAPRAPTDSPPPPPPSPRPPPPPRAARRCGHCKRMVGEYKALGEAIEADPKLKSRVVVAKVGARSRKLGYDGLG